jgi:hypothetical protein
MDLLASNVINVSPIRYNIHITTTKGDNSCQQMSTLSNPY